MYSEVDEDYKIPGRWNDDLCSNPYVGSRKLFQIMQQVDAINCFLIVSLKLKQGGIMRSSRSQAFPAV